MNPTDQITGTYTRQEWTLLVTALGELPTKHTYGLLKKIEIMMLEATPNADTGTTVDPV